MDKATQDNKKGTRRNDLGGRHPKLSESRKLRRLQSSSVLFCSGVPVRRTVWNTFNSERARFNLEEELFSR
jgi:hypothetical protein